MVMEAEEIAQYVKNGFLWVIVKPNALKTQAISYDYEQKALKIVVHAPADKNKANKEIIRFFSKVLKKKVLIKSGLTSRQKLLQIG